MDSEEIKFQPGFNVIVGQNNSGKTALIEALSLRFPNTPHRSLKTLPHPYSIIDKASKVEIIFKLQPMDAMQLLARGGNFLVPVPEGISAAEGAETFIENIKGEGNFICRYCPDDFNFGYYDQYGNHENVKLFTQLSSDISLGTIKHNNASAKSANFQRTYGYILANRIKSNIYAFKAERLNVGQSEVTSNSSLNPDASNLAGVLNLLQSSNPSRFKKLNELVSLIFPHVTQITVPPINSSSVKILVWSIDPNSERADLAIPLSESGTGIGQVLAILYIVINSENPKTILIDEPQSFLHPGAVRKLLSILKSYLMHQFIVSTHSPTAIAVTNPSTLTHIRRHESESIIETVDAYDTQKLRILLSELGARLSDVFGADNILWVEGPTEEVCFPLIIEKLCNRPLLGTNIIGVKNTGDFEGKYSKTTFELYEKLSTGKGLLPPALGFVFDRERRTEREREDLDRQSCNRVRFLPRRMFENFLLNPKAIATVLCNVDCSGETKVSEKDISDWIEENGNNVKYIEKGYILGSSQWIDQVHAARILSDIFTYFSECRVSYDKVEHGLFLTKWLIDNSPDDLREISDLLEELLNRTSN